MNIAIIGGGAAGMATAYLLNKQHDVTVFEKQAILGGNIRTLNKNVTNVNLDKSLIIDNGVIEFQKEHFHYFHKLMDMLNVTVKHVVIGGASSLFLADGRAIHSPGVIKQQTTSLFTRLGAWARLLTLLKDYYWLLQQVNRPLADFKNKPLSAFFKDGDFFMWQRMLLMYGYSIPYHYLHNFPAEIAMPILKQSGLNTSWTRIEDGVYTYIEQILAQFKGTVHCRAYIKAIHRYDDKVTLIMRNGETLRFDKVVFATPPDQILALLADPTEAELKRFSNWEANHAETTIHTDTKFYERYGVTYYSEFDVFQKDAGHYGYNAYLNRLCGFSPQNPIQYSLAYNLNNWLDPSKIIHVQQHYTPLYNVEAIRHRPEIIATNGENNTYHAGAYLGNGLHEGAIESAFKVAALFSN